MRYSSPLSRRARVLALIGLLASGACAYTIPEVNPADIPRLRDAIAADPQDTDLIVQLGMAQYKGEQYDQALVSLQNAVDAGNESGAALLYLGMTHEEFSDWEGARDAYSRYLEVGTSDPLKDELRKRLELIAQNVLREQARAALAQESELSGADPTPRSVAIFPFGFNSQRDDLEPLIYALSDMMITDFSVSNALTVLERSQIQTLLDEMALTEAGYADAGTGARAGRMLRAEHVVQGVITTLGDENLRLDTDVLNIPRSASAGTVSAEDALQNLFDMEKDLVFRTLRDVLDVQLTPAEEQAIRDNRADNVLAFLAYGRGLRAQDQGDYAGAIAAFQEAQQIDPGFDAAADAVNEAQDIQDASTTGTEGVATVATNTGVTGGGGTVAPPPPSTTAPPGTTASTSGTLAGANNAVNPTPTSGTLDLGQTTTGSSTTPQSTEQRDPVQESTGSEGTTQPTTAQIRIVIRRPGGGQ